MTGQRGRPRRTSPARDACLAQECPRCGAMPGGICVSPAGNRVSPQRSARFAAAAEAKAAAEAGGEQHRIHREYGEALDRGGDARIEVGCDVLCDSCSTDLTTDPRSGGYLFGSYAIGPCCAERHEATVRHYGEERFIRGRCPEGASFADWVRGLRGPDAAITITAGFPADVGETLRRLRGEQT